MVVCLCVSLFLSPCLVSDDVVVVVSFSACLLYRLTLCLTLSKVCWGGVNLLPSLGAHVVGLLLCNYFLPSLVWLFAG